MQNYYPENKSGTMFKYFVVAVLFFVLGWQGTVLGWWNNASGQIVLDQNEVTESALAREDVDLDLFWLVWNEIENKYVDIDNVDRQKMIYGAIKGLVEAVGDNYSVFMDPEANKAFMASLEGELEGIGAELTVEEGRLVVVTPLRESPAEKAGLLPNDIIVEIDGKSSSNMTLFDAIMNIRGQKGTTVTLTILREDLNGSFEVSIVRDSIEIESVTVEKLDGGVVYLGVNQFNDKTTDEFGQAISEMILDPPTGIIVDLRYNGGGYLNVAVEMLSFVLPADSPAVIIRERGSEDEVLRTNGGPKLLNIPIVVLMNEGSASASEIFAGAIEDHDRGITMGTQSFGKGSVQEVESFNDSSSLRLTIAKWFTPDDRAINGVGLVPNIIVEITDKDIESEFDRQKDEAMKYLLNL